MTFYERYRWFRGRTGAVGRDAATALDLARAERWAEGEGLTAEWVPDEVGAADWGGDWGEVEQVLGCVLSGPGGEALASLWSVGDPDRDYRRLVEAELACDALYESLTRVVRQVVPL